MDMEERFWKFITNEWPHYTNRMERRVGHIEGKLWVLIGGGALVLSGIVTLVVKSL